MKPTRPRRVIDLDQIPQCRWPIEKDAVFIYKRKLWSREPVGCVLCVELDDPEHVTLCHVDDFGHEHFHCMEHGELVTVPYSMLKVYTVTLGQVRREGEEALEDVMLFPAEMTLVAQTELIEKLLQEAIDAEEDEGPGAEQP